MSSASLRPRPGSPDEDANNLSDGGVNAMIEVLQIGVLLLIPTICVVALVLVWRDDHKWRL